MQIARTEKFGSYVERLGEYGKGVTRRQEHMFPQDVQKGKQMKTREIPKEEWTQFFDRFSRQHEGWLITMEIFRSDIGDQVQECELTFQGITDEWDEVSGNSIFVMTGSSPDAHMTHNVEFPTHVSLQQTEDGAEAALFIKSADGTTQCLRFRSPMLPEWVDGVVPSVTHVPL